MYKSREDRLIQEKLSYAGKFPMLIFPENVRGWINELVRSNNATPEFLACSILSAVSTAIGTSRKVRIKNGIENYCCLFVCLVGKPGTAKTPAIQFAYKPIKKMDRETAKEYNKLLDKHENSINESKYNKKAIIEPKPKLKKVVYSDYTIESFVENHANNPRGVCVVYDELAGWFKNFTRYNTNSEQETWLSIWSGESINVIRKGSGSTHIETPFANVIGGIQPSIMNVIAGDGRGSNGFISRFLFCFPSSQNKKTIPRNEMDFTKVESEYNLFIKQFYELKHDFNEYSEHIPFVLGLSELAKDIFYKKNNINTEEVNEEGHAGIRDFKDKTFHYLVRFSLIIELMHNPNATEISGESMHLAEHLFDYFYSKINTIFEHINNQPVKKDKFLLVYEELDPNSQYSRKMLISIFSEKVNMSVPTIDRRLKDTKYFTKNSYGFYVKSTI